MKKNFFIIADCFLITKHVLRVCLFSTCLLLVLVTCLWAAQDTTVIEDNAPIRLEPKVEAEIIEYIALGSELRISSYPMPGGWYKVRSRTGIYGFIHDSFLSIGKREVKPTEDESVKPERDRKWHLRVLGGYDFWGPDDLNDIFGFKELNTGVMVGGEFGYFLSSRVAIEFRAENLFKDIVAKEVNTSTNYNLGIRSYPIMLGFDFYFVKLAAWRLSLGIFSGVAFSTTFTTEAFNLASPNTVILDSSPFTALGRFHLNRPLGRILSLFLELGYRYLQTTDLATVNSVNGGGVFIKSGKYKTRVIDLSGPEVAVGIGVHF